MRRLTPQMFWREKKGRGYLAKKYEWQSWMRIDQTVVPWATLWLFYFEEWLGSNDWKGGGAHPEIDDERDCGEAE